MTKPQSIPSYTRRTDTAGTHTNISWIRNQISLIQLGCNKSRTSHVLLFTALVLALISGVCSANSRADWIAQFDSFHAGINSGNGWSLNDDSHTLAWGQSNLLQAYLSMYEATSDTKYLDWFENHIDNMKTTVADNMGDGYLGWWSSQHTPNIVREVASGETPGAYLAIEGVEEGDPNDSTLPKGWSRWYTPGYARRYYSPTHAFKGDYSMALTISGVNGWVILEKNLELNIGHGVNQKYEPGREYRVDFWTKTTGDAVGRAEIYDYTAGQILELTTFQSSTYDDDYGFNFTAPTGAGNLVNLRLYENSWKPSGTVFFDDVSVRMYDESIVHDGMISAPLARFAELVYSEGLPDYYDTADYCEWLVRYNLDYKWNSYQASAGLNKMVFKFPTTQGNTGPGNTVPINQFMIMGRAYASLSKLLGSSSGPGLGYKQRAQYLTNAFVSKWSVYGSGSYVKWNYWENYLPTDWIVHNYVEDTSHANLEVAAILDAHEAGFITLSSASIGQLVDSFKDKIWNGELGEQVYPAELAPKFNTHIDGGGIDSNEAEALSKWGWLRLAPYDTSGEIHAAILEMYNDKIYGTPATSMHGWKMHTLAELIRLWP